MLHDQSRAACPCPCSVSMSMSILHLHVHVACPCQCCMSMSISMYISTEMPECQTVRHLVSPVLDWKKLTMLEQVRHRSKLTQSGICFVLYRTKIRDAGMPMPALDSSMPMPSYAFGLGKHVPRLAYSMCNETRERGYMHGLLFLFNLPELYRFVWVCTNYCPGCLRTLCPRILCALIPPRNITNEIIINTWISTRVKTIWTLHM